MYKVSYPPPQFIKSIGKNINLWRGSSSEYHGYGKANYVGKDKGEAISSSLLFWEGWEEYQVGKGEGDENFEGKNQDKKMGVGKYIKL